MLEKEFEYFQKKKNIFMKKYKEKVIVIVGEKVVGVYNSRGEAYRDSLKKYELGTFLIQKIYKNKDDFIMRFSSRVHI